jgi:hypothetical protein
VDLRCRLGYGGPRPVVLQLGFGEERPLVVLQLLLGEERPLLAFHFRGEVQLRGVVFQLLPGQVELRRLVLRLYLGQRELRLEL